MTTGYLLGGAGNQLFIIAATYAFSKENNEEFGFDFTQGVFTQKPATIYKDIFYKDLKEICLNNHTFFKYNEPIFPYVKIPYLKGQNMMLYGYFQSEKYFINYKDDIIKLFKNQNIIDNLFDKYQTILKNSISIHIRRGDYLNLQFFHPCPPKEYYTEAINLIDNKKQIDNILVFSDDIKWCKENFEDKRMIFIENQKDYEDLYLMSLCENNIIANSSFSWWGSYLNENIDKTVIAPKIWFGKDAKLDWRDIYYTNVLSL